MKQCFDSFIFFIYLFIFFFFFFFFFLGGGGGLCIGLLFVSIISYKIYQ